MRTKCNSGAKVSMAAMGRLPTGRFLILPAKTPGKQTGGYRPFTSDDATVAYRPVQGIQNEEAAGPHLRA